MFIYLVIDQFSILVVYLEFVWGILFSNSEQNVKEKEKTGASKFYLWMD